jgi:hypothetical protein
MTCAESLSPVCGVQLYVFRQDLFGSAGGVRGEFNASGFETQVNRACHAFLTTSVLLAQRGDFIVKEMRAFTEYGRRELSCLHNFF